MSLAARAENIHWDDYTPMELAHAYRQAVDWSMGKGLTWVKAIRIVAKNVNKSKDHLRDYLGVKPSFTFFWSEEEKVPAAFVGRPLRTRSERQIVIFK